MRVLALWILAGALAAPAWADVTIKQTSTGKGLGMSGAMAATTYLKGMKMRTESVMGDTTRVTIFDLEAQKMYAFETKKKDVDVWDMAAFAAEIGKNVDGAAMTAAMTANGQKKTVAGQAADGYDMAITMPTTMGGAGGPKVTVQLNGPVWIVKNAPGTKEFADFYRAAVERGWIFSDPRAAKGAPGQARAMAQMYKQMADAGGMPYESEVQIKLEGEGPMAGLMARMGGMNMSTVVQSVETGALADDLFAPPAGFKQNNRK